MSGDALLMFGTSQYHASNVFLAFCPLRYTSPSVPLGPYGPWTSMPPPVPHPQTWKYFVAGSPPRWLTAGELLNPPGPGAPTQPTELLAGANFIGEISVIWHARLKRWLMVYLAPNGFELRSAREPWGPWSAPQVVFNWTNSAFAAMADNDQPGHKFVGFRHADESQNRDTVAYAPYAIRDWSRFDRSVRELTFYYTLSTEDPPYNVQLMRSKLLFK